MVSLNKGGMTRRIGNIDPVIVRQYEKYWDGITPATLEDRWRRWVFALLSSQTGWEQNADSYHMVMSVPWDTKEELTEILEGTRAGLHKAKAEGIWRITSMFRTKGAAERVLGCPSEVGWTSVGWQEWRNKLVSMTDQHAHKSLPYAGLKIVSFAHELCWPRVCGVVAIDTHVAQWYGVTASKITPTLYKDIEDHWLQTCKQHDYPSAMVRHILWDQEQGYADTSYWAHVFEGCAYT